MRHFIPLALCLALAPIAAGCEDAPADDEADSVDVLVPPDAPGPDASAATDTSPPADTVATEATDTDVPDTSPTPDTSEATDSAAPMDTGAPGDGSTATDATATDDATVEPPGPVSVSRTHWRVSFEDDFRGRTGKPSDDYCFDQLEPQCHIWPGASFDCDRTDIAGQHFFPPTRPNLTAAVRLFRPNLDLATLSDAEIEQLYGEIIDARLAHLDKCNWTLYTMLNWMATDYQGRWSARFDPTQVEVDPVGKGALKLYATRAPVDVDCIYGGQGGDPNCQVHGFAPGEVVEGVAYTVDADPRWPGVYYPPVNGGCPHGGTFSGVNCFVMGFPARFLEETGVHYWVDADPRWPGVYYANTPYRCRENIDYEPNLGFRNLTCPILNGGLMSFAMTNKRWTDPDGVERPRGVMQRQGRFEAKGRLPKGVGAFPAMWLMPESGGWPYDGGEIDVMEARDNADEVYQTYHHGKCYAPGTGVEMTGPVGPAECAAAGGASVQLSRGFTTRERDPGELWSRDHLFAVEWSDAGFVYYLNDVEIGRIGVGTATDPRDGVPASLLHYSADNFPTSPFYWILNHSTYVPPAAQAGFAQQTFTIDYVRNYVACGTDPAEYCPDGGRFEEGVGCVHAGGAVTDSPCAPADRPCVNGGVAQGARCRVWDFAPNVLVPGVTYWADADPRWPGVYYAKIGGGCPHGGAGEVNCQLVALPADVLEQGIDYIVDRGPAPPGVYYRPDFRD